MEHGNRLAHRLEEIGVTAPEFRGSARGAWVQLYNSKGKRLSNFLPGKKFPGLEVAAMDTDGNGKAEPVFLGTEASGARELQLRTAKGALQDRKSVAAAGTRGVQLLNFELDGNRGEEIGIAYTAKNGTGHFTVWDLSGKKLRKLADHSIIGTKSSLHQWLSLDIDDDGRDEMVATYAAPSGKGATLRVVDPRTGKILVNKTVLKTGFDGALWTLGDFDPDRAGTPELLVGYRKRSKGFFKVLAGDGTVLSTSKSISAKPIHGWGPIQSKPGPRGTARDLVFVGFTRPNGDAAFEVSDPSTKKAKRVGGGTVASDDYEVLSWHIGDFDGDLENGEEIVVVTRHLGDRSTGFQMFGRDGKARGDRIQAFDGTYINVSANALVFARKGRSDLALVARQVGGQPEVHVWNVNGETLLKKLAVLSKDVE